jgi:hypothetical protein
VLHCGWFHSQFQLDCVSLDVVRIAGYGGPKRPRPKCCQGARVVSGSD